MTDAELKLDPVEVILKPMKEEGRFEIVEKDSGVRVGEAMLGVNGFEALKAQLKKYANYILIK